MVRKVIQVILSAALLLSVTCVSPAYAADSDSIVILGTNDVHCGMEQVRDEDGAVTQLGYTGVAAYKSAMEAQYGGRVTLVDAGDAIQGNSIGMLSKGDYPVEMMNRAGYDFAAIGNHEFNYGIDTLFALSRKANYQYLCCNMLDKAGATVFNPYSIVDYGETQVAYVGITTPATLTKSTPASFQDGAGNYIYNFCETDGALYAAVQSAVDKARAEGADYVVALAHLGESGSTEAWRSDTVIANTSGIDVMLDGHSHEAYDTKVTNRVGKGVVLLQTGTKLGAIAKVIIEPKSGQITTELVTNYQQTDAAMDDYLKTVQAIFEQKLGEVVAHTDVALTTLNPTTQKRAIRSAETNLGDLCADAFRSVVNADVAIANGGGIRADIPVGDITYGQIIDVQPYSNQICVAEVTGQQLLDALELSARFYPEENGGFLQVSGMTYNIDPAVASTVVLDAQGGFVRAEGARRVSDVTIGGKPLVADKLYRLAGYDYMLKHSGSGFTMFKNCNIVENEVMLDSQTMINYITKTLGGTVGAAYSNPAGQGRITMQPASTQQVGDYVVRAGDCLWTIAARHLGSGARWQEIYQLNREVIKDPALVYIGQQMRLPA